MTQFTHTLTLITHTLAQFILCSQAMTQFTHFDIVNTHFDIDHTQFDTVHTLCTSYDTVHTHFDIVHIL